MDLPEKLTPDWLTRHAEHQMVGAESRWRLVTWDRVAFLEFSHPWSPKQVGEYVRYISGIPRLVQTRPDRVFLIFEITLMELREDDLELYLPPEWMQLLDRESLSVCLVDQSPGRRDLWDRLYTVIGKRSRVQIFGRAEEALAWVRGELAAAAGGTATPGGPVADRIGEFLVRNGAMTPRQVECVLGAQLRGDERRFGEIALEMGFVRDDAIERYVEFIRKHPAEE